MLSLGPIALAQPWALAALVVLPAIWWLLRLTPPLPKRVVFPPIRLLFNIVAERETSARTPWWLLILRLLIAALIVFAAARPLWNPQTDISSGGPVLLVVDNGWASAERWDVRQDVALSIADKAVRSGRQILLLATAPPADGSAIQVQSLRSGTARDTVAKLNPSPWPTDRGQATDAIIDWADGFKGLADIRWLSDGLDGPGVETFSERLKALGRVTVYGANDTPVTLLRPPRSTPNGLEVKLERTFALLAPQSFNVRGLDAEGRVQVEGEAVFDAGAVIATMTLRAPTEILNRVERVQIDNGPHVGAVVLLDQRWLRKPVGIIDIDSAAAAAQPLLSNSYYIERALEGSTTVRRGTLSTLFNQPLAILVIPDAVELSAADTQRVENWMEEGGILVRFAGPGLARQSGKFLSGGNEDTLLPVTLRAGDRVIGGAMSWSQPMGLQPFPASSPFAGLSVPRDVKINRQVLAQPAPDLSEKTWAALSDGTPLVTAERRDQGWVVLFHTSPNTSWSNLPISGVFVEMMQRIAGLGRGVKTTGDTPPLPPNRIMDAFGHLGQPATNVQPIDVAAVDSDLVSEKNPPGIYGAEDFRRAFNLSTSLPALQKLPVPEGWSSSGYEKPAERDMTGWLFMGALVLFLLDTALGLWVRAGGSTLRPHAATLIILMLLGAGSNALADERFALENSLETRLAYLKTGDDRVDDVSASGLSGLTTMLARRTAAELGTPQPVVPGIDDLTFFPLIYWPVTEAYELDDVSALAVKEYLRNGGTILFDTQDRGGSAQGAVLRDIAERLDLPALVPVDASHVLTRSFYLLDAFPGRYAGSSLWVERAGERINDGVSPIVAGNSDWAAAWAMDAAQRPLFPVVPGGERQREMAFRFGINLVMYVLTGNYKADQVHMPEIIKRLGQ